MRTNTITGQDHPDYVHEGETPYVIDGLPELTTEEFEQHDQAPWWLYVVAGALFGLALFLLGRWSAF
jgi:hypothetical protein